MMVNKEDAIMKLLSIKNDILLTPKFKGKSAFLNKVESKIRFLIKYRANDNVPKLMIEETIGSLSGLGLPK